ncbi:MAG TPA: type VI secretion system baseplate subunit TssG [Pseudomonadales bacterium]|nr:type VI secretion system baseplate subunit TssG [Pseudomonadales bacterium]
MDTGHRRTRPALIEHLQTAPQQYQAMQVFRLLSCAGKKPIRVRANAQLEFVTAEIESVAEQDKAWTLTCNAGGLFGSQGILPIPFTEELIRLQKEKNHALLDFLNAVQQRYFHLLFASWRKHRPNLLAEQEGVNPYREVLQSLCGFSNAAIQEQLDAPHAEHLRWAGLWARPIRSAAGLKQFLHLQFGVSVRIEQFIPSALPLSASAQTQLSQLNSANNQLGVNSLLGDTSWQLQYRFAVQILIRNQAELTSLQPGSPKLSAMQKAIALYCGPDQHFSIKLHVNELLFDPAVLTEKNTHANRLGWGTQLGSPSCQTTPETASLVELEYYPD